MKRLQRTAWTTPRKVGGWQRFPRTTAALAIGIQSIMSVAILAGGATSGVALAVGAIGGVVVAFNVRNALVNAVPGLLTVIGAATAFGTGWASVPVLGVFGLGSWAVTYLIDRTKSGRRENYYEPVAAKNDIMVAGGIVGASAALTAVVFIVTILPKLPLLLTAPAALLIAAVSVVALGSSLQRSRAASGNEDYYRVGTQLEERAASGVEQIAVREDPSATLDVEASRTLRIEGNGEHQF